MRSGRTNTHKIWGIGRTYIPEKCMQYIPWLNRICNSGDKRNITMTSWWAWWRLKSPASQLFTKPFVQAQIKETSKLRFTGLCEGNSPVTGKFPAQRASNAEKCFHLMTSSGYNLVKTLRNHSMWHSQHIKSCTWIEYVPVIPVLYSRISTCFTVGNTTYIIYFGVFNLGNLGNK